MATSGGGGTNAPSAADELAQRRQYDEDMKKLRDQQRVMEELERNITGLQASLTELQKRREKEVAELSAYLETEEAEGAEIEAYEKSLEGTVEANSRWIQESKRRLRLQDVQLAYNFVPFESNVDFPVSPDEILSSDALNYGYSDDVARAVLDSYAAKQEALKQRAARARQEEINRVEEDKRLNYFQRYYNTEAVEARKVVLDSGFEIPSVKEPERTKKVSEVAVVEPPTREERRRESYRARAQRLMHANAEHYQTAKTRQKGQP